MPHVIVEKRFQEETLKTTLAGYPSLRKKNVKPVSPVEIRISTDPNLTNQLKGRSLGWDLMSQKMWNDKTPSKRCDTIKLRSCSKAISASKGNGDDSI